MKLALIFLTFASAMAMAGETATPSQENQGFSTDPPGARESRGGFNTQTEFENTIDTWTKSSRGLYQIPTHGEGNLQTSLCHSVHHNPDRAGARVMDTYASKHAACVHAAVLQEWRRTECKEGDPTGCQISLGDVSHPTNPRINGLATHTDGNCFNYRPMQKGPYRNRIVSWRDEEIYDRKKTIKFIELLLRVGGTRVIFNDPMSSAKRAPGLDNVINVCFDKNAATSRTCANFKYDESICGPLNPQ